MNADKHNERVKKTIVRDALNRAFFEELQNIARLGAQLFAKCRNAEGKEFEAHTSILREKLERATTIHQILIERPHVG